jgi:hypothetical protein
MRHVLVFLWLACAGLGAQEPLRQEIPTNFAPAESIKPAILSNLSPEGRFLFLPQKGTVLIIDRPDRVAAVAKAIQALNLPEPQLELNFGVRTGGMIQPNAPAVPDPFANPVRSGSDFPIPTEFAAPRVVVQPNGSYVVIPATPTRFERRSLGTSMEAQAFRNTDGTVSVNLSYENVEFAGFINYGSPVLAFGVTGTIQVPVFDTSRISTSVIVYPERKANTVSLQLIPQVTISDDGIPASEKIRLFREFRTKVDLENGKLTTLRGFRGAPDAFNEVFFGDEENPTGKVELVIKAQLIPVEP